MATAGTRSASPRLLEPREQGATTASSPPLLQEMASAIVYTFGSSRKRSSSSNALDGPRLQIQEALTYSPTLGAATLAGRPRFVSHLEGHREEVTIIEVHMELDVPFFLWHFEGP